MGTKLLLTIATLWALTWPGQWLCAEAHWTNAPPFALVPLQTITTRGGSCTGSVDVPIQHTAACTLTVAAAGADAVLTGGGSTLATSYKLVGGGFFPDSDPDWIDSANFAGRTYRILGTGTADPVTVWVRGTASPNPVPDAGTYTASVTLTLSW